MLVVIVLYDQALSLQAPDTHIHTYHYNACCNRFIWPSFVTPSSWHTHTHI